MKLTDAPPFAVCCSFGFAVTDHEAQNFSYAILVYTDSYQHTPMYYTMVFPYPDNQGIDD